MLAPHFFKRIGTFTVALLCGFLMSILASIVIHFNHPNFKFHLISSVIIILSYITFIFIIIRIWQKKLRRNQSLFTISIAKQILWLVVALAIMFITTLTIQNRQIQLNQFEHLNAYTLIYIFIFYVCFAPIVEETLCRGWFLSLFYIQTDTQIDRIINTIAGCIISASLSTFMHGLTNFSDIFVLFVNGLLAAILYTKTNSLLLPILFHVTINILAWIGLIISYF